MAVSTETRQEQIRQAEELLFSQPRKAGFAEALFFGEFLADRMFPYPQPAPAERDEIERTVAEVRAFAQESIDPFAIDRNQDIPREVIDGLGRLGVLGMAVPKEYGGRGMSQTAYCRVMEVIGGRCGSTAVFVNAHHSIGVRALVLFGTAEQKRRWLPPLATGEQLAAFALTEPEAGSDAANVQTSALPSGDGSVYVMNGQKRYITNGSIAQVLTIMARTPVPGHSDTRVTAFLVTPDLPGFEVTEARMEKVGIRGTATSRLAFHDMPVPADRVLGQLGRGLKIALTVLDFGRTTFGASCTGAAKACIEAAAAHARNRRQFGQALAEFEMVQKKLAHMAAHTFAMESAVYQTAALIDRGEDDYMVETAMLKLWASEALWQIVNDTIQIFGGQAFFTNEPYERMMRDARLNQIGEGANDVMRSFIALVGMHEVGTALEGVLDALKHPIGKMGLLARFAGRQVTRRLSAAPVPARSPELRSEAGRLGSLVSQFGLVVERLLRRYREAILDRQYQQERIADAATELYLSACVLARLDDLITGADGPSKKPNRAAVERDLAYGRLYLELAERRVHSQLASLWKNADAATSRAAAAVLKDSEAHD